MDGCLLTFRLTGDILPLRMCSIYLEDHVLELLLDISCCSAWSRLLFAQSPASIYWLLIYMILDSDLLFKKEWSQEGVGLDGCKTYDRGTASE